jgi:hypothetical protein
MRVWIQTIVHSMYSASARIYDGVTGDWAHSFAKMRKLGLDEKNQTPLQE